MNSLSKLYVDQGGALRCGQPNKTTSRVFGGRIKMSLDWENKIIVDVVFTNEAGVRCHGYLFSCEKKYSQEIKLMGWEHFEHKKINFN